MSLARPKNDANSDNALIQIFCELLGARTGLNVRDKDREHVYQVLERRCHELRLSISQYIQVLRSQNDSGHEWRYLLPLLTNGESYFERDKGQFELLKTKLLPELIEKRRKLGECTLRLWSAGCSTGEEAYSLAMIVDSVLPSGWKATVLGTDINIESLQKGRRGIYGAWSFRGVEHSTMRTYFRPVNGGQQITASLRPEVKFEFCNLSAPDWPDAKRSISNMDLIVCRNVLIYFQRSAVSDVLARFVRTLRPGGFLLTGHTELHDQNVAPLRTRLFVESAVYQKAEGSGSTIPGRPRDISPGQVPSYKTSTSSEPPLAPSVRTSPLPRPIVPTSRSQTSDFTPEEKEKTAQSWCEEAYQHANSGRYKQAIDCCRKAININSSYARAYYVWAQICEELGQTNEAKNLLRKVIYLAPSLIEAYLDLASLYEREGDRERAHVMRSAALETLRTQNAHTPEQENQIQHIETMLGQSGTRPLPYSKGDRP